ncbi:MAG: hypothetical protein ACLRFE_03255 [Clostridia bacterium]
MHKQLLKLYTIYDHLSHPQIGHMSIYITPSGKIFDCRYNGMLSHCDFTQEFYENYEYLKDFHLEINFNTDVSEFILEDKSFKLKDIKDYYLEQFYDVAYVDAELYNQVKNNYLALDNLLVQDLGFVKVSINRGELPAIMLPMNVFNNKNLTVPQYNTLYEVLENNTISCQDFNTRSFIKQREKELRVRNNQLENILSKTY